MEPFYIYATLAAVGYAVAAVFSKQALSRGAGVLRLSFIVNWAFLPIFATLLFGHTEQISWKDLYLPALAGTLFFIGQVFTFAAIRVGDVSLQTPMMGTKAVFAVLIAVLCGTEPVSLALFLAAAIAMAGVAFLGFSGSSSERVGLSLSFALLSSLFFAAADTMVGVFANDFGGPAFLFIMMLVNALLSFSLVPYFDAPLKTIAKGAWPWLIGASILMAGQALLLNYTIGQYQRVAELNILYSTRGLWSVIFGAIALKLFRQKSETKQSRIYLLRFAGALMMCVAIAILLLPKS